MNAFALVHPTPEDLAPRVRTKRMELAEDLAAAEEALQEAEWELEDAESELANAKGEEELEEAEDWKDDAEREVAHAADEVERLEEEIDATDPEELAEPPLRVVVPEHVKAGWGLDLPANQLAEMERKAAGGRP